MPFFVVMRLVELMIGVKLYKAYGHCDSVGSLVREFLAKSDLEQVGTILAVMIFAVSLFALVNKGIGWLQGRMGPDSEDGT